MAACPCVCWQVRHKLLLIEGLKKVGNFPQLRDTPDFFYTQCSNSCCFFVAICDNGAQEIWGLLASQNPIYVFHSFILFGFYIKTLRKCNWFVSENFMNKTLFLLWYLKYMWKKCQRNVSWLSTLCLSLLPFPSIKTVLLFTF